MAHSTQRKTASGALMALATLASSRTPAQSSDPLDFVITTIAGNGEEGYDGDGVPATQSRTNWARDVAVGPDGSIYFSDHFNWRVRRIRTDGIVETVAGVGVHSYTGDGGPASEAGISRPRGLAVTPGGALFFADTWNHVIRRVDADGTIHTVCGTGEAGFNDDGRDALETQLDRPTDVAVGEDGSIYISDAQNQRIRRVKPDGVVETFAGNGEEAFSGDGGDARAAAIDSPSGISLGPAGELFITDEDNHRIRRVDADGTIRTVVGSGEGALGPDDVPPLEASLLVPRDVTVGPDGTIYVADSDNHRIAMVRPGGRFRVLAGDGTAGYTGDGGPARKARMSGPKGIAVGPDGAVYVADSGNFTVRRLAPPVPTVERFRRGDVDLSGGIAITDPIVILNALFASEVAIPCLDAADADDSGAVNITDAIYILRFQFLGTAAPPPPLAACGEDPTADELGCQVQGPCEG
ncbi:MAG: SMP-30/gluconolactonase/LRE family protein [Planctomycetes bacterium]|nr:SMP-30/gluconolactonase/LRE family protein [Planctomycetota bacterium]